jgi:hypothetical protein
VNTAAGTTTRAIKGLVIETIETVGANPFVVLLGHVGRHRAELDLA